jgi:hypothetical protein
LVRIDIDTLGNTWRIGAAAAVVAVRVVSESIMGSRFTNGGRDLPAGVLLKGGAFTCQMVTAADD